MCQKHLNFLRTPYLMGSPTISCCLWPGCSVSMHTVLCTWFWKRENLQLSPDVLLLLLLWNHIMLCSLFIEHSINTQFIIISHLQRTNPSKRSKVTPEIFFFGLRLGSPLTWYSPFWHSKKASCNYNLSSQYSDCFPKYIWNLFSSASPLLFPEF